MNEPHCEVMEKDGVYALSIDRWFYEEKDTIVALKDEGDMSMGELMARLIAIIDSDRGRACHMDTYASIEEWVQQLIIANGRYTFEDVFAEQQFITQLVDKYLRLASTLDEMHIPSYLETLNFVGVTTNGLKRLYITGTTLTFNETTHDTPSHHAL